jgi:hypothetical protein
LLLVLSTIADFSKILKILLIMLRLKMRSYW